MGRKPTLTPAIQTAIVEAVARGIPLRSAALMAGIAESTVTQWMQRGEGTHERPPTPLFVAFVAAIQKARADDEARRIERIQQAGAGGSIVYEKTTTYPDGRTVHEVRKTAPQWQADAWHLERSRPDDWGRRNRIDVSLLVRQQAEKLAQQYGLEVEALIAEAERLSRGRDV